MKGALAASIGAASHDAAPIAASSDPRYLIRFN
jgi:hypothetical protein